MNIEFNDEAEIDVFGLMKHNVMFDKLPPEVQQWAESLPWNERRYVLSLCYILCASSPEKQAEFLDEYTADGLMAKMLEDIDTLQRVKQYLSGFQIKAPLNELVLREYIRQFYIHSAQDARCQPSQYLESALKLALSPKDKDNVFNYIIGFEMIKLLFQMSWVQHERLSRLQTNQDYFIKNYLKPIQHAHKVNGIIVPKDERVFFAKRDFYVQKPEIKSRKLIELVMATFTTSQVIACGFSLTRHSRAFDFDYDYIFNSNEPDSIFPWGSESMIG
ncbi:cobyrinic acid a,c-diamide synthase [Planktothrix paucivesiculata]|uniref:Cobyrinic acid a,c-diamide synthase n=1 Tax=Planktothrix paucivesiculata PCC 9631 TaxID=671071 RepID=A0A7Z9DY34_9CYAN|nr:Cobyrinic acid a,c-diamide synthase [Planktothrix paucivesiculata PCC 9631]